jgi:hypothetical protein
MKPTKHVNQAALEISRKYKIPYRIVCEWAKPGASKLALKCLINETIRKQRIIPL